MTNNRPLLYALLVVLLAGLVVAVGWAGYNLLSLAFDSTPTPTAVPTLVTVVVVATPTATASPATATASPDQTIIPAITPTTSPAPGEIWEVVVVADLINVRTAPGLDQPIIGSVPMGTVLRPEGRTADGQWLLACCAFGQWGWVANQAELVALNFDWALLPVVQFPTPQPPPPAPTPTWTPWPTPLPPLPTWTPAPLPTWTPWPTWTPVPQATATPVPVEGWRGEYFTNPNLQGAPVMARIDPDVRFNWGFGSPAPVIPADNFSVRWTRTLWFSPGHYRFQARVDDGVRVWLNDTLIIDEWRDGGMRTVTADRTLAGGWHSLRIEYYERTGEALIDFTWQLQPQTFTEWRGDYFANPSLSGQPVLVRNDIQIAFNWGFSSPAPGVVPADNFSVRWTRQIFFASSDIYRFSLRVDDGARVRIDGVTILDAWREGPAADFTVDRFVQAGMRTVEVEYFDRSGVAEVFFNWSLPAPPPPPATWTPTATPTWIPTWTPTATATWIPTWTPTATATRTPTQTPTAIPTWTPTATPTTLVTGTPTATATATPTPTATATSTTPPVSEPSSTPTATETALPTDTPTAPATRTPTATPTAAETATPTETPTETMTPTATPTAAETATLTETPTATATTTPTATEPPVKRTPTATPTSTETTMPTDTPTATPTATEPPVTRTPTATPTSTVSRPTRTPTATPTSTVSRPTRTPTATATPEIAPSIVISPTEGTIGTTIIVTGTNWRPNDRVTITISPPRVQPTVQQRNPLRVRVDRNGNFRASITVPNDPRLIQEPVLWVVATGSRNTRALALFTMLPPDFEPAPILPSTPLPPPIRGTPSSGGSEDPP